MAVLYRTYRPQKFAEVVDQRAIVKTLMNAVRQGTVAHAYLFTGNRGVGKTTLARILAKAVNCLNPKDGDACLSCVMCAQLADGSVLDIVEIDAASHTGVENVRELIEHVQFRPAQAKFKVFIIDEVHMLSKAAFNALLKTLEEPPSHVIFILATTEIQKVPVTIISRAQRFDFSRIEAGAMKDHLVHVVKQEGLDLGNDILDLVVQKSEGGLRDALSLLEKIISLGQGVALEEVLQLLGMTNVETSQELYGLILEQKAGELPKFFERVMARGVDPILFNKDFLEYLRLLLVAAVSGQMSTDLAQGVLEAFQNQLRGSRAPQLIHTIRLFLKALKDSGTGLSPELPMLLASIEAVLGSAAEIKVGQATPTAAPVSVAPAPVVASTLSFAPKPVAEAVFTPKKKPMVEAVTTTLQGLDEISFPELQRLWPEVIVQLKTVNSPLATLVKSAPLLGVEQGVIQLGVHYLFHKEHLESTKINQLLLQTIGTVSGKRLSVSMVLQKPEEQEQQVGQSVDDALKIFGGELV